MSPDRTAPTSLRPTFPQRGSAPDAAPADGFAALLTAADKAPRRHPAEEQVGRERGRGGEGHVPGRRDARPRGGHAAHDEAAAPGCAAQPSQETPTGPVPAAPVPAVVPADAQFAVPGAPLPAGAVPVPPGLPFGPPAGVPVPTGGPAAPATPPIAAAPVPPAVAPPATPVEAAVAAVAAEPAPAAPTTAPALPVEATLPAAPAATVAPVAPVATAVPAATETPAVQADATPLPSFSPQPDQGGAGTGTGAGSGGQTGGQAGGTGAERLASDQPVSAEAPAPSAAPASSTPVQPGATPVAPQTTAALHQAPRAVAQLLHVAVDRGISHAKLNLRPADLGGIEIRLQTSAAGVTAQVVADSPEAARLLEQAAGDLRRSLERQDVTLLSLDVSTAGEDRFAGSSGAAADLADQRAAHHGAHGGGPERESAEEQPVVTATVQLPDGLLVDVLA